MLYPLESYKHNFFSDQVMPDETKSLMIAAENGHVDSVHALLAEDAAVVQAMSDGVMALFLASQNGHVAVVNALLAANVVLDQAMSDGATALWMASQNGHVAVVKTLLAADVAVDQAMPDGVTPLWIASQNGHVAVVKALLAAGAAVNAVKEDGATALLTASQHGHIAVVKALLAKDADVDQAMPDGVTPLLVASQKGHVDVVKALLAGGAAVNQVALDGAMALWVAAENGHAAVIKALLGAGAVVNEVKEDGITALFTVSQCDQIAVVNILFVASQNGYVDVVKALLAAGATVDQAIPDGATALLIASQNGHVDVVKALLAAGAAVDQVTPDGATALLIASQKGHVDVVKALLAKGADVNKARTDGVTPLLVAAENGDVGVVQVLLKAGAAVNHARPDRASPLFLASQNDHIDVVNALLAAGALVDQVALDEATALFIASENGYVKVVQALLAKKASVNQTTPDGVTALWIASQNGHVDVVKALLAAGALVDQVALDGATALFIASENGYVKVVEALLAKKAIVNQATPDGATALWIASQNGHVDVINALLAAGAVVDQAFEDGTTPLMIAAEKGHIDVIKALMNAGADPSIKNSKDETALILAKKNWPKKEHFQKYSELSRLLEVYFPRETRSRIYEGVASSRAEGSRLDDPIVLQRNYHQFIHFIKDGDEKSVQELINNRKVNLNQKGAKESTALKFAAYHGNWGIVKILLDAGVNIDEQNSQGDTLLMSALKGGRLRVATALVAAGANLDIKNNAGETPRAVAIEKRCKSIVPECFLVSEKAGIATVATVAIDDLESERLPSKPQRVGAKRGRRQVDLSWEADLLKDLAPRQVKRPRRDDVSENHNQFMQFIRDGNEEGVQELINNHQIDHLDQVSAEGVTALGLAALEGKSGMINILLAAGASIDFGDDEEVTALMHAVAQNRLNIVKILLAAGANINLQDAQGNTAFMHAIGKKRLKVARTLLEAGADPNIANKAGETPLSVAKMRNGFNLIMEQISKPLGCFPISAAAATHEDPLKASIAEISEELLGEEMIQDTEMCKKLKSLGVGTDFNGHDILLAKFFNDKGRDLSLAKQKDLLTSCLTALNLNSGRSAQEVLAECWKTFADGEERVQKLEALIRGILQRAGSLEADSFNTYGVIIIEQMLKQMKAISIEELFEEEIVNRLAEVAQEVLEALGAESGEVEAKIEVCRRLVDRIFVETNKDLVEASACAKHRDDARRNPSLVEAIGGKADPLKVWLTDSDINAVLKSRIDQANANLANDEDFDEIIVGENVLITQLAERLNDFIKRLMAKNDRIKEIISLDFIFRNEVTVYIPINLNGAHWVTGCFTFQLYRYVEEEGAEEIVLTKAKLIDSLARDESQAARLLTLFSSEVTKVNADCEIAVEATGVQTDAIRCGDYTCREILTAVSEYVLKDKKDGDLRNAVIERLRGSALAEAVPYPYEATPLLIAVRDGHVDVVNTLLAEGVYVDQATLDGVTPLLMASERGHVDVVKVLLAAGAAVDQAFEDGTTPLMMAAKNGHIDVIQVLIHAGANRSKTNSSNETAFMLAEKNWSQENFRFLELLKDSSQPSLGSKNSKSSKSRLGFDGTADDRQDKRSSSKQERVGAKRPRSEPKSKLRSKPRNKLVENTGLDGSHASDSDYELPSKQPAKRKRVDGNNLALDASREGPLAEVAALAESEERQLITSDWFEDSDDAWLDDEELVTVFVAHVKAEELFEAIQSGDCAKVQSLIAEGVEVNVWDAQEQTPLMYAALYGHFDVAQALIAAGADTSLKNSEGETALTLATKSCRGEDSKFLDLFVSEVASTCLTPFLDLSNQDGGSLSMVLGS